MKALKEKALTSGKLVKAVVAAAKKAKEAKKKAAEAPLADKSGEEVFEPGKAKEEPEVTAASGEAGKTDGAASGGARVP